MSRRITVAILAIVFLMAGCTIPAELEGISLPALTRPTASDPGAPPPPAQAEETPAATAEVFLPNVSAQTALPSPGPALSQGTPAAVTAEIFLPNLSAQTVQPSPSPAPNQTPVAPTSVPPTDRPQPETRSTSPKPYGLQPGSPAWLPNFSHPEAGCNWLGVAGQVFDANSNPVSRMVVEIGGNLQGNRVLSLSLTGVAPVYGPGGYEVVLGNRAVDSTGELYVQLFDLQGNELTDRIFFDTFADCNRNLILINFVERTSQDELWLWYFPNFLKDAPRNAPQ
jgi:hypothetical protein